MNGTLEGVLIAIPTCHAHRRWEYAQRQTWMRDVPEGVDCRFFLGSPRLEEHAPDEVFLDVGDGYPDLYLKTIAVVKWALGQGYRFMYKTDIDTLVIPRNLLAGGFEQHDYSGGVNDLCCTPFVSGGSGYWLSKKAMEAVAAEPPWQDGEDVVVACTMGKHGIAMHGDPRYKFLPDSVLDKDTISWHLSSVRGWKRQYAPEQMFEAYGEAMR